MAQWYTKGTFHAKMGTIKDRNGKDLTEAEDIKKRWQEYSEEAVPGPSVVPSGEPGVSGDFWGSSKRGLGR